MTEFEIMTQPLKGKPQTFMDGDVKRPLQRSYAITADSEEAAKLIVNQLELNIAIQEAGEDADPDDVVKKQYVITKVEER